MSTLRFVADMNISPQTVYELQQLGWDIVRVTELLPQDSADNTILQIARQDSRIVITQDLDFSKLLALGGFSQPSLITLRLGNSDPDTITRTLITILPEVAEALLTGVAVTVTEKLLRVRKLPV